MPTDSIRVTGARQNNLRGLSCDIPLRKITVITGVSGSGKSSLAFDTLYAESHRRFLDSVSTAGRQAFEQFERPDVENIGNLPPAVAIEQKSIGRNPRSTVGTMTEIYDYLRLLFARLGTRHCPDCGLAVEPLAPDEISRRLAALAPGTRFAIRPHETDGPEAAFVAPPQPSKAHDRAVMSAVKAALDAGHGALCARIGDRDFLLHSRRCCFFCRRPFLTPASSAFSYNHPAGMCPDCHGLGVRLTTDPALIVTDPDKSVLDGASPWWADLRTHLKRPNANWMKTEVFALAASMGVDLELPWAHLPEEFRRCALFGTGGEAVRYRFTMSRGRSGVTRRPVAGAVANIDRLFRDTSSETTRDFYLRFMREQPCETCCGERLAPEGRLTTLAGRRYPEAAAMSVAGLRGWVDGLSGSLDATRLEIGADILRELRRRLRSLAAVGVGYLTLDRSAPTLSGGEAQRIRLAAQLGGGLTGLLYVLDEPSIGLHPRDHGRLLDCLRRLRDAGNTVVVVEHDADTMRAADRLIDIGPGAGETGGRLVAEGTPDEVIRNPASLTGRYLSGQLRVADPRPARRPPDGWLTLAGARLHTLRGVTARIPLGVITCVTGVSGSGKSSLIARTLQPALARALHRSGDTPGPFDRLEGIERVDRVIGITQSPIGRTPRSNPATYTGVFDDVREMFAGSPAARERGWTAARFSFNSPEGRCEGCGGDGRKRIEMHFMPDVWITCPACRGRRFNDETLEVRLDGLDIAAVLDLDIAGALRFFAGRPAARTLQTLADVGLGYLRLGQSALTLSGGEAQRVKLAKELSRPGTGRTVYILDEPTTGLHFADIRNLIGVLSRIADAGNTVIVIEHNMDVISSADWVIDMGPEGGPDGGEIVAEGTPEDVARSTAGHTGRFLARRLNA